MIRNYNVIIDFIYDNFRYGSQLPESKVNSLFQKYPVSSKQKEEILEEFKSLNITILSTKGDLKTHINELNYLIGDSKVLKDSLLIKWYQENHIKDKDRLEIRNYLDKNGYSIINNISKEKDFNKFDFLNDLNLLDLDTQLDSKEFISKIDRLKSPVHSDFNLQYLDALHSVHSDYNQKQESLDNLVNANINLVWKVVSKYEKSVTHSFDVDDMFQHGMLGLIKAAEKFDLSMDTQFSTYAIYWIRQSITRGIMDYSKTIRLPVHLQESINKMKKVNRKLETILEREPLVDEIAAEMDLLPNKISDLMKLINNQISLDTPVGEGNNSFLKDFITDEDTKLPNSKIFEQSLKEEIDSILNNFTEREREIIIKRFGLHGEQEMTLEEVGKLYGVTRERIRQIESKTLKRMRHRVVKERLRDYFEVQ